MKDNDKAEKKVVVTFEYYILVISTIFSVIGALASTGSTIYTAKQASIAREAMSATDRNAAFVDYYKKLGAYCSTFGEVEPNGKHTSVVDVDGTLTLLYDGDAPRPSPDERTDFQNRAYNAASEANQSAQLLGLWLNEAELRYLNSADMASLVLASHGYEGVPKEKLIELDYVTMNLQKAVACIAVRNKVIKWFKNRSGDHDTNFPSYLDVEVVSRIEPREEQAK